VLRQRLPLMFIALSALWALAAHAEDRIPLKSVNVEIPFGDRMFEGPGSDVANNNCLACHSAGMVLDQPALSQAQWRAEVEKMLTAYKAPVDPKDVDAIVAYLVSIKGAK
jgi:cytochrome c553